MNNFTLPEHAERVFNELNTILNQKFTIVKYGEMGFLQKINATLTKVKIDKYAQYDKAIYIEFIPKGKRSLRCLWLLPYNANVAAIWKGFVTPDTDMYKKSEKTESGLTVQTSYLSCSDQYMIDALASVPEKPFIALNCDNLEPETEDSDEDIVNPYLLTGDELKRTEEKRKAGY
jgi:hypothetical protein